MHFRSSVSAVPSTRWRIRPVRHRVQSLWYCSVYGNRAKDRDERILFLIHCVSFRLLSFFCVLVLLLRYGQEEERQHAMKDQLELKDDEGMTLVMIAARSGNVPTLRVVLEETKKAKVVYIHETLCSPIVQRSGREGMPYSIPWVWRCAISISFQR